MSIYSYNRLDQLWSALYELRYYTTAASGSVTRAQLQPIGNYTPGQSLDSLEAIPHEGVRALYKRLLREDLRFGQMGHKHTKLVQTNQFASSLTEWMDGIIVAVSERNARLVPNMEHRLEERSFVTVPSQLTEALRVLAPAYQVRDVRPPSGAFSARYGTLEVRLNPDLIPEDAERFRHLMPGGDWDGRNYGPCYNVDRYPSYARNSIRVAGNGRLVSLPTNEGYMVFIDIGTMQLQTTPIEQMVENARTQYRNQIRERMRQWRNGDDSPTLREKLSIQAASAERFEKFRAKMDSMKVNDMVIPTLPFVEPGKGIKSSRRWGIEIETGAGRDLRGVPSEWDSKGDGSLESAYAERARYIDPEDCPYNADNHDQEIQVTREGTGQRMWVDNPDYIDPYDCEYCGDREDDYYDDDDCVELVSPILTSMHSRGLRQICEDLEHAPRTDSAGIHVHVEAKDLSIRQIKELVMGYDHIEHLIESSYDRKERGYCKRRSARELLEVVRQPEDGIDPTRMKTGDRYVTVNLCALYAHGTIEFRAMGPRYNYDHLVRWAMFCREMVNVFANGARSRDFAQVKTWADVLAIFARFGSEYNYATVGQMDEAFADQHEDIEVTV